ncbi:MAG: hypothetical protein KDD82_31575 [Planctomycetes bacterium]|nr:hypothetical protein [Planctomycetota bacterium]
MNRSTFTALLGLAAACALVGCGGGSGSSRGSTAAPIQSSSPSSSPSTVASVPSALGTREAGVFGGRGYVLYVPQGLQPTTAAPVLLALHDAGSTPDRVLDALEQSGWLAAADAGGALVLAPETLSPASWTDHGQTPAANLTATRAELSAVVDLAQRLPNHAVDPRHLHALGFGDGATALGQGAWEQPLGSVTLLAGAWAGTYRVPTPAAPAPAQIAVGLQDPELAASRAAATFLGAQGHELRTREVNAGHDAVALLSGLEATAGLSWILARPLPAPATTGSGGAGGQPGLSTRTITTVAQAGLPSVQIAYDVYVPAGYSAQTPIPLVVAANMGLTPWQALADAETIALIDFRDHDRNGGFNFNYDVLGLQAILQDVQGAFNVDTKRVYYHGFSAGAHFGYAVVLANANTFAGLGINAGSLTIAIQQGIFPGQVQRQIPVVIQHGTQDAVVPVQAGQDDRARLSNAGHPVELNLFTGGHTVRVADAQQVWAFLQGFRAP